jgi:hypothetical protein
MRAKGKEVLLLIGNFSAYKVAIEQIEEIKALTNTKVMWLPPNATSVYQPLDQGIIQNWKSNVKKQFVMFMAKTFDQGKDLSKEIHVLRAVRWGISAWENDVTPGTIQNCWARSQCVDFGQFPTPPPDIWSESQGLVEEIRQGICVLKNKGYIVDMPNVQNYISPYKEQVIDDCPEDIVDEIVGQYTQRKIKEDDGPPVEPPPPILHEDALCALHTLRRYKEENQYGNIKLLRMLRSHEREISSRCFNSREQTRLDR